MSAREFSAKRLLELYDRLADAPDAIKRLRKFALDLAVRGKLVEQDPDDEPASVLLERIAEEKKRLGIKHTVMALDSDDVPFELPYGWRWSRIGEICSKTGSGSTPRGGKSSYRTEGVPFLRSQNIYNDGIRMDGIAFIDQTVHERMSGTAVFPRDLLLNITGGSIGRCALVPASFAEANVSQHVAIIRPAISGMERFLHCLILSPYFQVFIFGEQTGAGRGGLPKNKMDKIAVALPPLSEQQRIVAKVDELMALLDRLETTRTKRETTRDRLTTASLTRLTAPDTTPKNFPPQARFAINTLPTLTTRPDQIKTLRQTIFNLAVRGKLVEQDPADESASDLLRRIAVEKPRLVREGKFKTLDEELDRDPGSFAFAIPANWSWCYLDDIAAVARGGSPRPIKAFLTDDPNGIPWIKIGDSKRGSIYIEETQERIKPGGLAKSRLVIPGDLLLSNSMSFGFPYITNVEGCIHDGWLVIRTPEGLIDKLFLHKVFLSDHAKVAFSEAASGAVVQNLNADKARQLAIPLPPLAEQHRVVAKVDALMTMCDRVQAVITTADNTKQYLLEALLHGALTPALSPEMEAAE